MGLDTEEVEHTTLGETSRPSDSEPPERSAGGGAKFPIVAIGASAGGLAAFEAFFGAMPGATPSGMAFVLVQHLAPDHKSILSDLVKRYTRMRVFEVEDGMVVEPDSAYIIPPNHDMSLVDGALRLLEPSAARGQRLPIDHFFRSLAEAQGERAICIVLSGTGSDGTLGVRAVKAQGGLVIAQNPESTEYDGMPRSAIATGLVDHVLPPAEMPAMLLACASGTRPSASDAPRSGGSESDRQKIFFLLRSQTGHDFAQYKQNTINRRIERRMAMQQLETLEDYARYCEKTPNEVDALFHDLLIGVTGFFRDPEAFEALGKQVIERLITEKPASTIRVWVPGCSTGEEAYSLAMLFREAADARKAELQLSIFATDIDTKAIATARAGIYPASVTADLTPERLTRHFTATGSGNYRIHKGLRDLLTFSEQDVVRDPPFSKLDLISCRNLMIYLGAELQKKLVPLFHYALNSGGVLFLGSSESVGEFTGLFSVRDRTAKLYQRGEDGDGAAHLGLGDFRLPADAVDTQRPFRPKLARPSFPARELTERALLKDAPSTVLVNERGELLYLHGQTGQYLEPAPGEPGVNILAMAREGLRHDLMSALHRATASNERVFRSGLRVKTNGDFTEIDLTVRPVSQNAAGAGEASLFLVSFAPTPPVSLPTNPSIPSTPGGDTSPGTENAEILALRQALRAKEESLQATREEMQTSSEELRSANEELQSTNEELQSSNEELETSKEELQSVNEELATVNAELQSKVSDLSRINNDMNNLLAASGIGTIFVDLQLCIRRFTPAATQFINLIQTDLGRPLAHVASNFVGYDGLLEDVKKVLDTLVPVEIEVRTRAGVTYRMRVRPYRTSENVIDGAVLTFTELTALKDASAPAGAASEAIVVRDSDLRGESPIGQPNSA